jgi:photosystem II stability/assembly factor-like uncharacterized protein
MIHPLGTVIRGPLAAFLFLFLTFGPVWGQEWTTDGPSAARVSAVIVLGGNPDLVLIGTNDGVFRSTDGGDHWARVDGDAIGGIIWTLSSEGGQIVLAGGEAGLFRSADGGVSWSRVDTLPDHAVHRVKFHPAHPGTILAATAGGVFRSVDWGLSWTPSTQQPSLVFVTALEIDPSEPEVIYLATLGGGVFRSEDRGDRWTALQGFPFAGRYVFSLLIDPYGQHRIYVGTASGSMAFNGDTWIGLSGTSFLKVVDLELAPGGSHILAITDGGGLFRLAVGQTVWEEFGQNEPDDALDLLVRNDTSYIGSAGRGVFRSRDGGSTWSSTGDIPVSDATAVMVERNSGRLIAGTLGGGVFAKSSAATGWSSLGLEGRSVSDVVQIPGSGTLLVSTHSNWVYRSTNGGMSWSSHLIQHSPSDMVADPFHPGVVYAATGDGVFKSGDDGQSWARTRFSFSQVHSLDISPHDGAIYSAGSSVRRTTDGWETYAATSGLPQTFYTAVWVSRLVPFRLYAGAFDGRLYVTEDLGVSWTLNVTLPRIRSITGSEDGQRLIVTTDGGVFESRDEGTTWSRRAGFATSLSETVIHPLSGRLIVATGAGVHEELADAQSCGGPAITVQPAASPSTIYAGSFSILSVSALASEGSLAYQWYRGFRGNTNDPVAGATLASVTVSPATSMTYWVRVTDGCKEATSVDSKTFTVKVWPCEPTITSQPESRVISGGESTTLAVAATNATSIRWFRGTAPDTSNQIGSGSSIPVSPAVTTNYWARVANDCGFVDSTTVTVTVETCDIARFTVEPADTSVKAGESATLSVAATGMSPITFTWYRGQAPDETSPIGSGTSIIVSPTSTTSYWAKASNSCGSVNSRTVLVTVTAACEVPAITHQPQPQAIPAGESAELSVVATGTALTYQWFQVTGGSSSPIAGATAAIFRTPPLLQSARYVVRVSNSCGEVNSNHVIVTVIACDSPRIASQPQGATVREGERAALSVSAAGAIPLSYQWFVGQTGDTSRPIVGATAAMYESDPLRETTSYWVRVTNDCDTIDSETATVTVELVRKRAVRRR